MSPRVTVLVLFLAFAVPSVLLVSLQEDSTNRSPLASQILPGYFAGTGPQEIIGSAAVPIIKARCLVRWVLDACEWAGGEELVNHNSAVQFFSAWAALCTVYLTAARLLPPARACAAVLLAAAFVPWGFLSLGTSISWPYDLPSFFFAAFGMWTVVSRRFVLFAATVVVGTLNKETIVFLLPAYVLAEWPLLPRKTLAARALILAGLFLAAYEFPRMILAGNPLPVVTVSAADDEGARWQTNLQHLLLRGHGTKFENVYWALSIHVLPLLRWSALPRSLRAIYLSVPVLLVPIFFYGNIYELRLYNEIIPLGAIATVLVFTRLFEATVLSTPAPAAVFERRVP